MECAYICPYSGLRGLTCGFIEVNSRCRSGDENGDSSLPGNQIGYVPLFAGQSYPFAPIDIQLHPPGQNTGHKFLQGLGSFIWTSD
jgi:hypothetical protein